MAHVTETSRTAWLFTRGHQSVRLETRHTDRGVTLRVAGPGPKRASYDFADQIALLHYQAELESHLVSLGFALEQFVSDRRKSPRPSRG
jgi:hypothetical protein